MVSIRYLIDHYDDQFWEVRYFCPLARIYHTSKIQLFDKNQWRAFLPRTIISVRPVRMVKDTYIWCKNQSWLTWMVHYYSEFYAQNFTFEGIDQPQIRTNYPRNWDDGIENLHLSLESAMLVAQAQTRQQQSYSTALTFLNTMTNMCRHLLNHYWK